VATRIFCNGLRRALSASPRFKRNTTVATGIHSRDGKSQGLTTITTPNGGIASLLQSACVVAAIAELFSFGRETELNTNSQ